MRKYNNEEFKLLAIQIGCLIRLARLKSNISQHDISLIIGTSSTNIGRIERSEHISGWDKLLLICQHLNIDYCKLFILKEKKELISIVEESFSLENKLNQDKRDYYSHLKKVILKN